MLYSDIVREIFPAIHENKYKVPESDITYTHTLTQIHIYAQKDRERDR